MSHLAAFVLAAIFTGNVLLWLYFWTLVALGQRAGGRGGLN